MCFKMLKIFVIALFLPALLAAARISASRGQFPHQVAILEQYGQLHCGGALLTPMLVLTAASCEIDPVNNFTVLAAAVNHKTKEGGQQRYVAEFIPHENFVTPSQGFDIAIVRVKSPFHFNKFVHAIPLDTSASEPIGVALASGWGRTVDGDNNSIPEDLQTVSMSLMTNADCAKKWGQVPLGTICATAPGLKTSRNANCDGDSGGPLSGDSSAGLVIVGVVSYGFGCAGPPIYTSVNAYVDWIEAAKSVILK